MPKINVYLPESLAEAVKDTGVPVSAVCQHALELAVRRVTMVRATISGGADLASTQLEGPLYSLTSRAHSVLADAQRRAQAQGAAEIGTGHLLGGMLAETGNLALRVLQTLDIESAQIQRALDQRAPGAPAAAGSQPPPFGPHAAAVCELAVNESTGLGNNYVGCEHLLLGLVGEPDGEAGQILRGLGAELRATRRAVAAALAGYLHHVLAQSDGAGASALTGAVAAQISSQLSPVLARIDALEQASRG